MPNEAMIVRPESGLSEDILSPVMDLAVAKKRLAEFQSFVQGYLIEGEDYGTIPGTPKPCLLKPGADKLCELYGLADSYEILDKVEEYEAKPPLFDYTIRCTLTRIRTQLPVASGVGSCSTYESRYRWRKGVRACPQCGTAAIIKGKDEYGGGWLCWQKKEGCGAKFSDGDAAIEKQNVDRVENEDIIDQKNTVLKMAKKRAKVDATLSATRSSGIFTQDEEVIEQRAREAGAAPPADNPPPPAAKGKAPAKAAPKAAQTENVMCSQCQGMNGHTADCPTQNKQQAPQDKGKLTRLLYVDKLTPAKSKTGTPYLTAECTDRDQRVVTIYCYHGHVLKHADTWLNKWCEFNLSEKPSKDGKKLFLSVEEILNAQSETESIKYQNSAPVTDQPTGYDLGFGEPPAE